MAIRRPRGTNDFLPEETPKWQHLEQLIRQICREYGYGEIRTPIFEYTELFQRGVGDTTDIVEKEMFTFTTKGEDSYALRPEGTASTVRAYIENKLYAQPQPSKVYYVGPMFRYDRPQAGRYRQFHQFGVEVFGTDDPAVDAEVIAMSMDFYQRLGLKNLELHINSVGCPTCRADHRDQLLSYLQDKREQLCPLCTSRIDRNPMRVLDCKNPSCQEATTGAPTTTTCLCEDCNTHFEQVKRFLEILNVPFVVDDRLVRGLDYYTKTAFEIMAQDIGAQSSIGGGGRYNGLTEQIGGAPAPGIGFALGMERILLTMERQGVAFPETAPFDVFVSTIGDKAVEAAVELLARLRKTGLAADKDYLGRSLKAQMKYANKFNARYTVIIGEDELAKGVVVVRDMSDSSQEEVEFQQVDSYLAAKLGK